jgi:hypothetical protein
MVYSRFAGIEPWQLGAWIIHNVLVTEEALGNGGLPITPYGRSNKADSLGRVASPGRPLNTGVSSEI